MQHVYRCLHAENLILAILFLWQVSCPLTWIRFVSLNWVSALSMMILQKITIWSYSLLVKIITVKEFVNESTREEMHVIPHSVHLLASYYIKQPHRKAHTFTWLALQIAQFRNPIGKVPTCSKEAPVSLSPSFIILDCCYIILLLHWPLTV